MTDQPDPDNARAPVETAAAGPHEGHETKQRRLLFAIEVTLFGLVVLLTGNVQAGVIVAIFGLVIGLSGL